AGRQAYPGQVTFQPGLHPPVDVATPSGRQSGPGGSTGAGSGSVGVVMSELLSIVLIVAAVGYVLVSRFRGQPIRLRRLVVLPLVLAVIGGVQLANGAPAGMTATNWLFLVGDGVLL